MKQLAWISILLFLIYTPVSLLADPTPAQSTTHPKSNCVVESTAGEYPFYKVKREGKVIYAPKSDGIIKAIFSPNGRYIAFSGSEISGVDITPGAFEYSVVILECHTGALQGFTKGFPNADLRWVESNSLRFTDSASGKVIDINF
jgi:hypothetical protein